MHCVIEVNRNCVYATTDTLCAALTVSAAEPVVGLAFNNVNYGRQHRRAQKSTE